MEKPLTISQIETIRALYKSGLLSQQKLALAFETSQSTISRILSPLSGDSILAKAAEVAKHIRQLQTQTK